MIVRHTIVLMGANPYRSERSFDRAEAPGDDRKKIRIGRHAREASAATEFFNTADRRAAVRIPAKRATMTDAPEVRQRRDQKKGGSISTEFASSGGIGVERTIDRSRTFKEDFVFGAENPPMSCRIVAETTVGRKVEFCF